MNAARTPLPNRRPSIIETIEIDGHSFTASIGFNPATGQPRELFLDGTKSGSALDGILNDAAVTISVALQHGVSAAALAKSVARLPVTPLAPPYIDAEPQPGQAASVIGTALDLVGEFEGSAT